MTAYSIVLGLGVFLTMATIAIPAWLLVHSRGWHERHHQRRSEVMCSWCSERQGGPPTRVIGDRRVW